MSLEQHFAAWWDAIEAPQYFPWPETVEAFDGTTVVSGGRRRIMLSSNDRLGLAADSRVREAAADAARRFGVGLGSQLMGNHLRLHEELEQALAQCVGKPAALVFGSGYLAAIGSLPALSDGVPFLVLDQNAHACLQDGYRLARGRKARFAHNDPEALAARLEQQGAGARGALVATDGVFSAYGDLAPLPALVDVCRAWDASLMIDDAHGIGLLGGGAGTAAQLGVADGVTLVMGTFSKCLGSVGGFVAGQPATIRYLRHRAAPYTFSAALTPPQAAAALAALRILAAEPERRTRLFANLARMRDGLRALGYTVHAHGSPIVALTFEDDRAGPALAHALYERGIVTHYFVHPAITRGKSLIRVGVMATHTDEQIDEALAAFAAARP